MRNWYRNAKGRVFAVMPWRLVDYWRMTQEPDLSEFDISEFDTTEFDTSEVNA
jgi:4-hydroxyacetophenone monooxygenase